MKKPCENCPYRNDVKPYLTPERGEELAYLAQNKYNDFHCHKTTESDDEGFENHITSKSKMCAGFVTLQINEGMQIPKDFKPAFEIVYTDAFEMSQYYSEEFRNDF
jgi:hypothetical protein